MLCTAPPSHAFVYTNLPSTLPTGTLPKLQVCSNTISLTLASRVVLLSSGHLPIALIRPPETGLFQLIL